MDLREQIMSLYCKWCSRDCQHREQPDNNDCQSPRRFYDDLLARLQPWCKECGGTGGIDEVGGGGDDPVVSRVSCPSCKGTGKQVILDRISDEELAAVCGRAITSSDKELRQAADAQYSLAQLVLAAAAENYEARLARQERELGSVLDLKIKYQIEKHQMEREIEVLKAGNNHEGGLVDVGHAG